MASSTTSAPISNHKFKPNAERLKTQGNEFYQKGQYKIAYQKYSEAIKEDPRNPVYYANRSQMNIEMKEYMDAALDARKALKYDKGYVKAWGRLGTASYYLGLWNQSADAFKTAISCLPSPGSKEETDLDTRLRIQFSRGLKNSEKAIGTLDLSGMIHANFEQSLKMPWEKAKAIEQELIDAGKVSSGLVILHAHREFTEGATTMKSVERKLVDGKFAWFGKPDAFLNMTNGILTDPRAFKIDSNDWFEKYNYQAMLEAQIHKAWTKGGAKLVKNEAPQMLKRDGWDSLRPALSTTVRIWLLMGFINNATGKRLAATEFICRAVEILEWGRHTWNDVAKEDRGVIFELSFIRGVKRMRMSIIYDCIANGNTESGYTRDDLARMAREIIADSEANTPLPNESIPGYFLAAFWMYPRAEALTILGWYHIQRGFDADNVEDAFFEFEESARYYIDAAQGYPEDDEHHAHFFKIALEAFQFRGRPVKDMIQLCARIELALPKILKIWSHSGASIAASPMLQDAILFGYDCAQRLENGEITPNSVVKPKSMEKRDKWGSQCNAIYIEY